MVYEYRIIMYPKDKQRPPLQRSFYAHDDKQAQVRARWWLSQFRGAVEPWYSLWRWVEMERKE